MKFTLKIFSIMTQRQHSISPDEVNSDSLLDWGPTSASISTGIAFTLGGATLFLLGLLIYLPEQTTLAIGAGTLIVLTIIGRLFLMCGKTRLALFVLVVGFWGIATGIAFFNGGVRATTVIVYPMIIGLAAWLISVRTAVTMTASTVAVTIGFVLAESWRLLPVSPPTPPVLHGIVQIILFITYAAVAAPLVRVYQDRLKELSQHKQDLQKRETELHRAQEVSSVGSWVYTPATDTLHLSAEMCRIFGLPAGSTESRAGYIARIYLPDRQTAECAWQDALQSGIFEHEHRIVVGDSLLWIHQKAEVEFAADGAVRKVLGIAQDLTVQKQAQIQLSEAMDMLQSAVRAGQVYPWVWDLAQDRLRWGVPPVQLLGPLPEGEAHYKDFRDTVHPDDFDVFLAAGRSTLATGAPYACEFRLVRADGAVRWAAAAGELVRDAADQAVRMIGSTIDITQRKQTEEEMAVLAFFDPLTSLPNRTFFTDRLKQSMTTSARSASHGALLFIDLDNFKKLNDSFGHDMGDLLLIEVARRLERCVRAGDTVARLGGDEFVVVLTGLGLEFGEATGQVRAVGAKILATLNQAYELKTTIYSNTPSIGATLFLGQEIDVDMLLKQADIAMYKAKAAGRNALHFHHPGLSA